MSTAIESTRHAGDYDAAAWHERDDFPTLEHAQSYLAAMSRLHRATPYRIISSSVRERLAGEPDELAEVLERGVDVDAPLFVVEYVPSWELR